MLYHPLSIGVAVVDSISICFLAAAFFAAARLFLDEERSYRKVSTNGRFVLLLQILSLLLSIAGISLVFPPILTGIMCGTGVLQISGETGERMIIVRLTAIASLYVWFLIDSANRHLPKRNLDMLGAKIFLLSVPIVIMGIWLGLKTVWVMDPGQSGNCCSLTYGDTSGVRTPLDARLWLMFLAGTTCYLLINVYLCAGSGGLLRKWRLKHAYDPELPSLALIFLTALSGILWCLPATVCLIYIFSSYYYGVSQHHCLWCLFLPRHYSIGYLMFLVIATVLLQSIAIMVNGRLGIFYTQLSEWTFKRIKISGRLIITAVAVYFISIITPAVF